MPVRLGTVVAPDLGFHRRLGLGALRGHGVLVGVIVVVVEALALNARFVVTPSGFPAPSLAALAAARVSRFRWGELRLLETL
jgi:hypothetical protein